MPPSARGDGLDVSLELRIDDVCRRFEAEWQSGRRPDVDPYLAGWNGPDGEALREELKLIESEYRRKTAELASSDGQPHPPDLGRVGDFRLLRAVGRGGMGVVYEAVQESLGRRVALKLLPPEALLDPNRLERFRREAKAAARLHHTNIVPVFGTGEAGNQHFFAMQFIDGSPLDAVIDEVRLQKGHRTTAPAQGQVAAVASALATGTFAAPPAPDSPQTVTYSPARTPLLPASSLPATDTRPPSAPTLSEGGRLYWATVARVGAQVADALAYAHAQGVLHRDIKPANLLLDLHGTVWVTDFGLAKATDTDDLTHAGDILGTLRYMAPERFEGQGDGRADVYALGLTLYELLTLQPAFKGETRAGLVEQVLAANPPKPRAINPAIPRDLETVVLKAIACDPASRYQSARELADDLSRYQEDRPIRARRTTAGEQAWRWCRRNPAVAGLLATVLLVSVLGMWFTSVFAVRADADRATAVAREQEALTAYGEGQEKLFQSLVSEARASRFNRRVGQRFGTLETIRKAVALGRELGKPPEAFDELRNLAAALALPDVRLLSGRDFSSTDFVFDPRLERIARRDQDGNLIVEGLADGVELARLSGTKEMTSWVFTPDGNTLYLSSWAGGVFRWEVGTPAMARLIPAPEQGQSADGHRICLTADGKRLFECRNVIGVGSWVTIYDVPDGREVFRRRFAHSDNYKGKWLAALSPDGKRLAAADGGYGDVTRRTLIIFDVDSGRTIQQFPHPDAVISPVWQPDSRTVAVGLWNHSSVLVYDTDTGKKLHEHRGSRPGEPSLTASPSGQLLTSYGNWGGWRVLLHPHTGRVELRSQNGPDLNIPLADGRLIGHERTNGKLRVWAAEPSPVFRTIAPDPGGEPLTDCRQIAVHPGGRLAAVGTSNGVALVDLERGLSVGTIPLESTLFVRFDPVSGDLFTSGPNEVFRWRVRIEGSSVKIDQPKFLISSAAFDARFDLTADGQTLVTARYSTVRLLPASGDASRLPRVFGPCREARSVAISPDGRWITAENFGTPYQYFDARSGREVLAEQVGQTPAPASQPIDVQHVSNFQLALVCPQTNRRLVVLEMPEESSHSFSTLSPDGTLLLCTTGEDRVAAVWDVRELRRQLAALDLDWESPAFPPAAPAPPHGKYTSPPLSIRIVGANLATDTKARARHVRDDAAMRLWINPFDADAHFRLGLAALNTNNDGEAVSHFDFALALRPDHERALSWRASVAQRQGRNAVAVADADRALASGSNDPPTRFTRAKAMAELGRHADAISDLSAVLVLFPRDWEVLELRADCHTAVGQHDAATADRAAATSALDSATPQELNNRAWRLVIGPPDTRDPKRALDFISRAVKLKPDQPLYLNTLGVAQYRNGKYEEACKTLEKSLAAGKGKWDAFDLYFLAMCHVKLGAADTAKALYRRANTWTEAQRETLTDRELAELTAFRKEAEALFPDK